MTCNVNDLIKHLNLTPHQEGGYFRQTYKSEKTIDNNQHASKRSLMTSIYYLLTSASPLGRFHLNQSDITHYFHLGAPLTYVLIYPDGQLKEITMGTDVLAGQVMQMTVEGGVWKASKLHQNNDYSFGLIGEAVAPGFEYEDMQLAQFDRLLAQFPQHETLIRQHIPRD